jgi:hypothetical protein
MKGIRTIENALGPRQGQRILRKIGTSQVHPVDTAITIFGHHGQATKEDIYEKDKDRQTLREKDRKWRYKTVGNFGKTPGRPMTGTVEATKSEQRVR